MMKSKRCDNLNNIPNKKADGVRLVFRLLTIMRFLCDSFLCFRLKSNVIGNARIFSLSLWLFLSHVPLHAKHLIFKFRSCQSNTMAVQLIELLQTKYHDWKTSQSINQISRLLLTSNKFAPSWSTFPH